MQEFHMNPVTILIVEDNPGDARLITEVLNGNKVYNKLYVAQDGVEAIDFLLRQGEFSDAPRPDVILLDLNLPRMDGREVLAKIKSDPDLKNIPVVIMTTSQAEEDIIKSYSLHANCFITKPLDFNQFVKVVKSIEEFWFTLVKLPPKE